MAESLCLASSTILHGCSVILFIKSAQLSANCLCSSEQVPWCLARILSQIRTFHLMILAACLYLHGGMWHVSNLTPLVQMQQAGNARWVSKSAVWSSPRLYIQVDGSNPQ